MHAAAGADGADAQRVTGPENSGRGKSGQSPCNEESAAVQLVCHGSILAGQGQRGKCQERDSLCGKCSSARQTCDWTYALCSDISFSPRLSSLKEGFATRSPNEFGRGPLLLFLKDQLKVAAALARTRLEIGLRIPLLKKRAAVRK